MWSAAVQAVVAEHASPKAENKKDKTIKALTALVGQLSLNKGLESGPERELKTVSFHP